MKLVPAAALAALTVASITAPSRAQCDIRRYNVPDFDQRRTALANDGSVHCVPTSAANWMAYISNYGWPGMMSGPRNWQSQTNYNYVTSQIDLLGDLMGTSPPGGTSGSAGHLGIWVYMLSRAPGRFTVTTKSGNISPSTLWAHMYLGNLVNLCYGYYKPNAANRFSRDGGHCVTLVGVYGACSSQPTLRWRDPASDSSSLTTQSSFVSTQSTTSAQTFIASDGLPRTRWRLWALGQGSTTRRYVDRYFSINPLICLTASAVRADAVLTHRPVRLASSAMPASVEDAMGDGSVITGISLDTEQLNAYITSRTGAAITTTKYWRHNLATGEVRHLFSILGGHSPMVTGRHGDVYLCAVGQLRRYAPTEDGLSLVESVDVAWPLHALAYDDTRDEIVGVSRTSERMVRLTRTLEGVADQPLPSGVTLEGDISFVIDEAQQQYIMCGSESATVYTVGLVTGTPRLRVLAGLLLPAVQEPRGLQRNDQGHLLVIDDGVIAHFAPGAAGGWVPVMDSPLAGLPASRVLCVARSRHDITPDDDATPAWRHVTEPEGVAETVDCNTDWDANGVVNSSDISAFLTGWLSSVRAPDLVADFNNDGAVNSTDISAFLTAWLAEVTTGECG